MGKRVRDWTKIYAIYGLDDWQTPFFLLIYAVFFSAISIFFLLYFDPICYFTQRFFPMFGSGLARFFTGFFGSVTALSALCLFFSAANFLYSSVLLQWDMAHHIVNTVSDWPNVKNALDLGCGRGILLNAVALQLKKSGSSGRVVGFEPIKTRKKGPTTVSTLRTAKLEGVQEYVTCRAGDPRKLPFSDNYFDVVVSSVFIRTVGKEFGSNSAAAAAERMRVLGELVRVLKPGAIGVVWDLEHVPEYVQRLQEMKMEEIRVSEAVAAYMVISHVVSFKKPKQHYVGSYEVMLDWRFHHVL